MRVPIDGVVWHLDVDFTHPRAVEGPKGSVVRRLKCNMSWVQNVVRQFGPYLSQILKLREPYISTRGSYKINLWCIDYFL